MAMQMTHIRFALDLKEKLDIHDTARYLSGALYPDSRYFTKASRQSTHDEGVPSDLFAKGWTDFEKGWATHLYYDRVAAPFAEVIIGPGVIVLGEELWFRVTALKAIEDRIAFDHVPMALSLLADLHAEPAPRGEDPALLAKHYASLRMLYQNKPTLHEYATRYGQMGMPLAYVERIIACINELAPCEPEISAIYDKVLETVWNSSSPR